ncbi:MAG: U32 family peptidase [Nitrospirota bacterium]
MNISLAPIPYSWERDSIIKFYEDIKDSKADNIYIGEVVCSKRDRLSINDILSIAQDLEVSGKKIFISTLGLITNQKEFKFTEELCLLPYPVEVNNIGVLNILNQKIKESVLGQYIQVYNKPSLIFFKKLGVKRIVLLPELSREAMFSIIEDTDIEKEILGFGKLSLGLSWRCYTSFSNHSSNKNNCTYRCYDFKEGIPVETIDKKSIYTLNGTQILSGFNFCLLEYIDILQSMGIDTIRIQPQLKGTNEIIDIVYRLISKKIAAKEAISELKEISDAPFCNGWFFGRPGLDYISN